MAHWVVILACLPQTGRNDNRASGQTPGTSRKAERFIQTALGEWAYARACQISKQRAQDAPLWTPRYNWHRPHSGIKAQTPVSRPDLNQNNLLRRHIQRLNPAGVSINDDITPLSFQRKLESRRGMLRWRGDGGFCRTPAFGCRAHGHARSAGMACLNHWIPALAGMTEGESGLCRAATGVLGGLCQTPLYHLNGLFQMRLYRLGRWFQTRLYRPRPVDAPSRHIQGFLGLRSRRGFTTRIHAGVPINEDAAGIKILRAIDSAPR